jgi:hypothetical protein
MAGFNSGTPIVADRVKDLLLLRPYVIVKLLLNPENRIKEIS